MSKLCGTFGQLALRLLKEYNPAKKKDRKVPVTARLQTEQQPILRDHGKHRLFNLHSGSQRSIKQDRKLPPPLLPLKVFAIVICNIVICNIVICNIVICTHVRTVPIRVNNSTAAYPQFVLAASNPYGFDAPAAVSVVEPVAHFEAVRCRVDVGCV